MKTNMITYFFLFLSKTDKNLFSRVNYTARQTRIGLGIFVFCTAIMAFFTGTYFVRSIFTEYNESTAALETPIHGWIFSILLGLLWSLLIMNIEREIVSARNKWAALARLPLAIAIGLAIAIPVKVQFFADRINKELTLANKQENAIHEQNHNERITFYTNRIGELNANITAERANMAKWADEMEAEVVGRVRQGSTGISGEGPAFRAAERNYLMHKSFVTDYENQLKEVQNDLDEIRKTSWQQVENAKIKQSYDFLSQYEMMTEISKSKASLKTFGIMITLLFLLVESIPAIIKMLKPTDEYDAMEAVRTAVGIQTAHAAGNLAMKEIETYANPDIISQGEIPYSSKKVIEFIEQNN